MSYKERYEIQSEWDTTRISRRRDNWIEQPEWDTDRMRYNRTTQMRYNSNGIQVECDTNSMIYKWNDIQVEWDTNKMV